MAASRCAAQERGDQTAILLSSLLYATPLSPPPHPAWDGQGSRACRVTYALEMEHLYGDGGYPRDKVVSLCLVSMPLYRRLPKVGVCPKRWGVTTPSQFHYWGVATVNRRSWSRVILCKRQVRPSRSSLPPPCALYDRMIEGGRTPILRLAAIIIRLLPDCLPETDLCPDEDRVPGTPAFFPCDAAVTSSQTRLSASCVSKLKILFHEVIRRIKRYIAVRRESLAGLALRGSQPWSVAPCANRTCVRCPCCTWSRGRQR